MNLRTLTLTALWFTSLLASAANLVTNGDFEKNDPIGTARTISGTAGIAPISVHGPCCAPMAVMHVATTQPSSAAAICLAEASGKT